MTDLIPILFEGRRIAARRGEPLAAALVAHGHLAMRTTRSGAARGLFCGMGACQDCLVEIDGAPNRRACMEKVDRPIVVTREAHGRPLPPGDLSLPPVLMDDVAVEQPELLVIGAGPAGLSAALAARRAGVAVTLLDERPQPGGQYFKQSAVAGPGDAQQRAGAGLVAAVRASGVTMRHGVSVWGATPPRSFLCTVEGRSRRIQPGAAIIATGAIERAWPVPGWTLPGVMTTGAAQTLWRTAGRLPGRRVAIAGNGPLNLQLAAELTRGGADVVVIAELADAPDPAALAELVRMAMAAPTLFAQGVALTARAGGRLRHASWVSRVEPVADGLRVTIDGARPGAFTVDALCLGSGFRPADELSAMLDGGEAEGLFVAGDCRGLGGAHAAMAEGVLAGLAAAEQLGHRLDSPSRKARRQAERRLARHRRFQAALWRLYASDMPAPYDDGTILCRCEEVTFGQVAAARAEGLTSIGDVRRATRCGMGACQGRYCGPVLAEVLGSAAGLSRRVPAAPVRIGDLG